MQALLHDSANTSHSLLWRMTTSPHACMSKHGGPKGTKNELDSEDMWHPWNLRYPYRATIVLLVETLKPGSNCRLRPGEGAVESYAAAWGDEIDQDELCQTKMNQKKKKTVLTGCLPVC